MIGVLNSKALTDLLPLADRVLIEACWPICSYLG